MQPGITIRRCSGVQEFLACVALQKEVWKFTDAELVPDGIFIVADHVGGQVIGAFEGEALVGYVLAVPGVRAGQCYLHSHMLAVRPSHRDKGIGRALKLAQREDALQRGFALIEWTFDALEIKNAWLNIAKLGAIVDEYHENYYGETSSVLHRGLPTDRLMAKWWIGSKRVEDLLQHGLPPVFETVKKISVPGEIYRWRASADGLPRAAEVQRRNRQEFHQAFSQGLVVLGFECDPQENGAFLLGRCPEKFSAP